MSTPQIEITCRAADDGWACAVTVGTDAGATTHRVAVRRATLSRLAPGTGQPDQLVTDSFRFLLVREPRESILRTFDLEEIGRYFPEWEREIAGAQGR